MLFEREALYQRLDNEGCEGWARHLRKLCQSRFTPSAHGNMPTWIAAWNLLPSAEGTRWRADGPAVSVIGPPSSDSAALTRLLKTFHPWRKGPFSLFGVDIDTEWRSDLKWDRISAVVDFQGKRVLDVGCGNGYYGWRMLDQGAELVLGCDPFPLYWMQFEVLRRYAPRPEQHWLVPLADDDLPDVVGPFDLTLSMGVLYHRQRPLEHLQRLQRSLRDGGQLILETLIIESAEATALEPRGRYAKMKNVGAIPSLSLLTKWLLQAGFRDIQTIDVSRTTAAEQRRTAWMTFESLEDFLDPLDRGRTVEGYPAPVRGVVRAQRA